jgi:hypothetical protein
MHDTRVVRLLIALYAILCRWYPARFRAQFGDEMCGVFADACRDAQCRTDRGELTRLAVDTLGDFVWSLAAEHVSERRRQGREWVGPASQRPLRLAYLMTLGGVPLVMLGRVLAGPSTGMQRVGVMCGLVVHCVVMDIAATRFATWTVTRRAAGGEYPVDSPDCQVTRFAVRVTLAVLLVVLLLEPTSIVAYVRALGAAPLIGALWISSPILLVLAAFATAQPLLRIRVVTEPGGP